jgi:hypothetical protein
MNKNQKIAYQNFAFDTKILKTYDFWQNRATGELLLQWLLCRYSIILV